MAFVTFSAISNLASGYSSGDIVTLHFNVIRADRDPKILYSEKISYGGVRRRNVQRQDMFLFVETKVFSGVERDKFEMFLESVRNGESFSANFRGDDSLSMNNYYLTDSYKPKDFGLKYTNYSFQVKQI